MLYHNEIHKKKGLSSKFIWSTVTIFGKLNRKNSVSLVWWRRSSYVHGKAMSVTAVKNYWCQPNHTGHFFKVFSTNGRQLSIEFDRSSLTNIEKYKITNRKLLCSSEKKPIWNRRQQRLQLNWKIVRSKERKVEWKHFVVGNQNLVDQW